MRKVKNILVTGGAGFIGSAFIRFLLSFEEIEVKVLNYDLLTYAGDLKNLESVLNDHRYFFVKGDICDQQLFQNTFAKYEIDTIVHFAAETHVDNSIEGPSKFLQTNVFGTFSLLESIRKFPHIHFHHISTDEVYGELGRDGYFSEMTRYNPSSPYSASKASSDHLVSAFSRTYNLSTTISHCSNNYGPYQHVEKFIPRMITNALEGKPLPIYGKGKNIRDWLYVEDHAEAIWRVLLNGKKGEVYDIGGGAEKENIEVVKEIISIISSKINCSEAKLFSLVKFVEDRPGHDFRYAIDSSKIERELGWKPKYDFTQALAKTIEWYIYRNEKGVKS